MYVFADSAGTWNFVQKFCPTDSSAILRFGSSLAIEGSYALVGSGSGPAYGYSVTETPPPPINGDVNIDGWVGADDLVIVLTNWSQSGMARHQGDLTGEGFVGADDYVEVLTYWGSGTPPEPIPETSTLGLLLAGVMVGLRRRIIQDLAEKERGMATRYFGVFFRLYNHCQRA